MRKSADEVSGQQDNDVQFDYSDENVKSTCIEISEKPDRCLNSRVNSMICTKPS